MSRSHTSPTRYRGRPMAAWSASIAVWRCRRHCPPANCCTPLALAPGEQIRLRRLQQRLARAKRGSKRRQRTRLAIAKIKAREADRRRDWVEKTTTDLARRFDTIRVEQLDVRAMTRSARGTVDKPGERVAQKRGLNRAISRSRMGSAGYPARSESCGPTRTGPGCIYVATMLRLWAYRSRKSQEPSGLRLRRLRCGPVQRRRKCRPQHRRRTGGTSTGRPRRQAVCEL